MSPNAGRSHNIKIDNTSYDNVEKFKYLGNLKSKNSFQEVTKSRWNSGNACYHSVQNFCLQNLVSKNAVKIKIYRIIIFPVVLYGCETWSLTLGEERRLRVFENRVLRRILEPKRDEVTGEWRKLHNEELRDQYCSPNIVRVIKWRRMRWTGHIARMGRCIQDFGVET